MEIKFEKTYLEELFYTGKTTDKKYRFQPQIAKKYRKTIDILESTMEVEDLFLYNGFTPTHPGEVLKDEIEYRKLSQSKLAKQMGMSYKVLNDILNERRPVTTTTAMMFEAALGVPAYSLINIQTKYNMQMAHNDKSLLARLAQIRKIASAL